MKWCNVEVTVVDVNIHTSYTWFTDLDRGHLDVNIHTTYTWFTDLDRGHLDVNIHTSYTWFTDLDRGHLKPIIFHHLFTIYQNWADINWL